MMPQSHCFNGAELEYYRPLKVLTHHKVKEKTMLKSAGTSNLECTQHAVPGRKSLLACALLAMLAGNQAMADVIIEGEAPYVGATSITVDDVDGNQTSINAGGIDIIDENNNFISITPGSGILVFGSAGDTFITSDGSQLNGDLVVQGDVSVEAVNSTTINNSGAISSDTVTATTVNGTTVNGTTVNSTTIANTGAITTNTLQADTVSATTITGGTITGSLNAAGTVVSNVGDGVAETDGVNVRQLNSMQGASSAALNNFANEVDSRFNAVDRRIDKVEEVAYAGIASVAALAAIPSPANGKRFSVGAGLGNYSSESAIAVGFRAAITESTSVTAGVSRNTASKTAANLGVGYSW
ncbi:YadA-like family protein [Pseudomonas sp.]|uniref:YadA-like family protein n=1 Tax=Pseudomonas sp. TaxID=306 RepID=UPI00272EF2A9|nr:YadA-like family protein [Pseudomonas sp.]MDP2244380.1 YadA-like family protein [Pseudomonas sp.]